ncbi:hypothetical protein EF847_22340 [Actinobacteria bacterium YIM 96077]|uniref:Uncharacterized protein n=1 Tax=Phytoactinopolyspora halophila TaxID=1981511 RepID=A0A329QSC0_9ACTN|nr:hypothetical protein [Phytoactinopolyspora halophila]AYY15022.1 hypothetical protein EF847_22340 [Actinobacteria bacterium YIM 96077]RAW14212.1 hypothetical protein DPM12_11180 [Phytoactinopolyspora halophila]
MGILLLSQWINAVVLQDASHARQFPDTAPGEHPTRHPGAAPERPCTPAPLAMHAASPAVHAESLAGRLIGHIDGP